jgi:glutamate-5-semialdehyde dehydrogenase
VQHSIYDIATMSLTNASAEDAARAAKLSSRKLATLPTSARNAALDAVHDALSLASDILAANAKDLELAQKSATDGQLNPSIVKRLDLSRPGKFEDMLQGIKDVRNLDDPGRSAPAFSHILSFVILSSPC